MAWTFIRATYFLQNRSTTPPPRSASARSGCPPARAAPPSWTPATLAARAHTVRSHEGTACILTDPAALTDDVRRLHWPLARDFGSFTRDHASPGRQPPWPLPERLA